MSSTLQDKVCIITGGGSGMGRELGLKLAQNKARVVIVGRSAERLNPTAAELKALGAECLSFALDVADKAAVEAMAAEVLERWGRIDILVNNAGHSSKNRALLKSTPEDIHGVLNTNLVGTIYCTQAVLPQMLKQESGTVMNVSSKAATNPGLLGGISYGAAKAGVINFTGHLREEFKNKGIRFTVVIPGEVDTPILSKRPVPPDDAARQTMVPASAAADIMLAVLALPDSTSVPVLELIPTMLRDVSKDLAGFR